MSTSSLDPQIEMIMKMLDEAGRPALETLDPVIARAMYRDSTPALEGTPPEMTSVTDSTFPGPAGNVPIRTYIPRSESAEPLPVLVYYHGGGWVVCDLDTHDALCRRLADAGDFAVVSVDYRMGPEDKFPAAVEDAYAAADWVSSNGGQLGVNGARLAVAGDSAGGNLAAVVAHLARDRDGPDIACQLLIYPGTDLTMSMPSIERLSEGYWLTKAGMEWFRSHYLSSEDEQMDPRASPLHAANFTNLPSALVITAEFDPLVDEGAAYAEKLRAAGSDVDYLCYDGMIHGFFSLAGLADNADKALKESARHVGAKLSG